MSRFEVPVTDIDPYDNANPLVVMITSADGTEVKPTSTQFVDGEMRAFFSMNIIDEFLHKLKFTTEHHGHSSVKAFPSSTKSITVDDSAELLLDRLVTRTCIVSREWSLLSQTPLRDFSGYGDSRRSDAFGKNQTNPPLCAKSVHIERIASDSGRTLS
ncbi:MAG: hypothetical protein U0936_06715 [Planctomycetaceae bacterium]